MNRIGQSRGYRQSRTKTQRQKNITLTYPNEPKLAVNGTENGVLNAKEKKEGELWKNRGIVRMKEGLIEWCLTRKEGRERRRSR